MQRSIRKAGISMDYLQKMNKEELKDVMASLKTSKEILQTEYASNEESMTKREKNAAQAEITQCENAITLVSEFISYHNTTVSLTSKKSLESCKPACGKSVKKSAEKYLNAHKQFLIGIANEYREENKNMLDEADENNYYGFDENFNDFEEEITSGSFMRDNVDNIYASSTSEWNKTLAEEKTSFKNKHEDTPDNIADFASKFTGLNSGIALSLSLSDVPALQSREEKEQVTVKNYPPSIYGLLRTVHFKIDNKAVNENAVPISDRDTLNLKANSELFKGLSKGDDAADRAYLRAYQYKVKELLQFEMKPEHMSFEFLVKNPEYFFRMRQLEVAFDGYKEINNFSENFPKSYAFIQKYISNQNIDKGFSGQLIENKLEMLKRYMKVADAIMMEKGILTRPNNISYDPELLKKNTKIDTSILMKEAAGFQKNCDVLSEKMQTPDHATKREHEMTELYNQKMKEELYKNDIPEDTILNSNIWLDSLKNVYLIANRKRSVIKNKKYVTLINEIIKDIPEDEQNKEYLVKMMLQTQLRPYQNVDGEPVTEESVEIYNENIEKLKQLKEEMHNLHKANSDEAVKEFLTSKYDGFYKKLVELPEIPAKYVEKCFGSSTECLVFYDHFSYMLKSFTELSSKYNFEHNQNYHIGKAWDKYRDKNEKVNGVGWQRVWEKMDLYIRLGELVDDKLNSEGYFLDNSKDKTWLKSKGYTIDNANEEKWYKDLTQMEQRSTLKKCESRKNELLEKLGEYNKRYGVNNNE